MHKFSKIQMVKAGTVGVSLFLKSSSYFKSPIDHKNKKFEWWWKLLT